MSDVAAEGKEQSGSGRPKPKASRGGLAAKEIEHENRDSRDDCVYMETAPFLRLLKFEIDQYYRNTTITAKALTWIQFIVEQQLINILEWSGTIVREVTKGHGETTKRAAINARDIQTVVDLMKDCHPILQGPIDRPPARPAAGGRGSRGGGRGGRGSRGGGRGSRGGGRGSGQGGSRGRGKGSRGGRGDGGVEAAAPRAKATTTRAKPAPKRS